MPVANHSDSGGAVSRAVFDTTELREMILLLLPPKDLLLGMSVCKQWRDDVRSRHKFQQALFMLPEPLATQLHVDWTYDEALEEYDFRSISLGEDPDRISFAFAVLNPFLLVPENPVRGYSFDPYAELEFQDSSFRLRRFGLLPFANSNPTSNIHLCEDIFRLGHGYLNLHTALPIQDHINVTESELSWRRMFLTSPPIPAVDIRVKPSLFRETIDVCVKHASGITMGDVVNAIYKCLTDDHAKAIEGTKRKALKNKNRSNANDEGPTSKIGISKATNSKVDINKAANSRVNISKVNKVNKVKNTNDKDDPAEVAPIDKITHIDFDVTPFKVIFRGLRFALNKSQIAEFEAFAAFSRTVEETEERKLIRKWRKTHFLTDEERALVYHASYAEALLDEWEKLKGGDA